jgi:hypothetical protein
MAELIGSLDVEERARAKDTHGKGVESSSANMVQKKISNASHYKKKKKNKQENNSKPKQTTTFKKEKNNKDDGCFVCGSDEHWACSCPDRKFKQEKKYANMIVNEAESLPTIFQFVIRLSGGWTLRLIFMCMLILLCFLLIRSTGLETS